MNVLTLNFGSSSLKYAVHAVAHGSAAALLQRDVELRNTVEDSKAAAAQAIAAARKETAVDAVGHRIVFGGQDDAPQPVSAALVERLASLQKFDPLHAPGALAVISEAIRALPGTPQIACFDTHYFRYLPKVARALPLPAQDPLLRRYGFHGLSYESVVERLQPAMPPRTIVAHLGSGVSVTAFASGVPADTTMGFSPLGGTIMSTRPGDLDPGVLLYLLQTGCTVDELRDMLETKSGVSALSGGEGDLAVLCRRSDERAAFAVEMFVRSAAKSIAAMSSSIGGIDQLVFTGGIGEHNAAVRSRIAARTLFLNPSMTVRVVPCDENGVMARHTARAALLFEAERVDRMQARRFQGGVIAEKHADNR